MLVRNGIRESLCSRKSPRKGRTYKNLDWDELSLKTVRAGCWVKAGWNTTHVANLDELE